MFSKKKQFERLFASKYDFAQANFCACYLLRKGWHAKPWERRGTIYNQQTAFVTNLIVAYARPFVTSRGWPGFPTKLVRFEVHERIMHEKLMQMRHEVFAHSDSAHYEFDPVSIGDFQTTIELVPFAVLSLEETECIKVMTDNLLKVTNEKLNELFADLIQNQPEYVSD